MTITFQQHLDLTHLFGRKESGLHRPSILRHLPDRRRPGSTQASPQDELRSETRDAEPLFEAEGIAKPTNGSIQVAIDELGNNRAGGHRTVDYVI